jgi:hypothetical protein
MFKNKFTLWMSFLLIAAVSFSAGVGMQLLRQSKGVSNNFTLYGTDVQQNTPLSDLYISFPTQLNQRQQLEKIASLLSRYKFCELPIEVISIKDNIATINLSEHPWMKDQNSVSIPGCSGKSWRYGYFQGSAGGYSTTVTLARTFLQPQYKGQWIQNVQFYYNSKPIQDGDWDHINLDGVITRQNSP